MKSVFNWSTVGLPTKKAYSRTEIFLLFQSFIFSVYCTVRMDEETLEVMGEFVIYLGVVIDKDDGCRKEVENRVKQGRNV